MTCRTLLGQLILVTAIAGTLAAQEPHQASGVKVGEVTDRTAIVWVRLTASPTRNDNGLKIVGPVAKERQPLPVPVEQLEGACPGAEGRVRVRYGTSSDLKGAMATPWTEVTAKTDYQHQFQLADLEPDTVYYYSAETAGPADKPRHAPLRGEFRSAPRADTPSDLTFCVLTCQGYPDIDHADGFNIYPAMAALEPRFVAFTGDNVYYDNDAPRATSAALARYHWERMYSKPRHVELLRRFASYWEKDDHDTVKNDSWPGRKMGDLTFAEGQQIFRQQVPLGETIYRTFRWGRDLQIWLTDGRDFRSPNNMPDGPEKTIWGAEQKAWLKRTLRESDATWKVLISPTPIVGPDRPNKRDNHSNDVFAYEGRQIRAWIEENLDGNLFVICGDRHWQYHSIHPETGLGEFAVGAASDEHAGGSPGKDPRFHRFHRVKGGFLSVRLAPTQTSSQITFRHHDVHGQQVYRWSAERPIATSQ